VSRLAEQSQVAARIVLQNYRHVRLAFGLFKRLNDGYLSGFARSSTSPPARGEKADGSPGLSSAPEIRRQ
jgi:hypothetical protein